MKKPSPQQKTKLQRGKRSWPLTITLAVLAAIVIPGIFAAWRYLAHDLVVLYAVILPGILVTIFLIAGALNGRKRVVNDIKNGLIEALYFWQ